MPRVTLTPAFLRNVHPPAEGQVEYVDTFCLWLHLRLSHGGTASWVMRARDATGRQRRFPLGTYPKVGLAAAREKAWELREKVRREGADPIRDARELRQKAKAQTKHSATSPATLAALLDNYAKLVVLHKKQGSGLRSWPEARRRIEDVFHAHLARPSIEITAPELQVVVDAHPSRSSAGAAVRYLRPVFKWGAKRGLVARGTGEALDQPQGALTVRQRRLSRDEMHAILREVSGADNNYGHVMHWLFLTACRLNEACGMRWQDVDLRTGVWTIPVTKTDKAHAVPLPRQALTLLREVMPVSAQGDRQQQPMPTSLVFCTPHGDKLTNWHRETQAVQHASGTTDWHRHDIRRSVASLMGDLGIAPHVVEIALGHAMRSSSDGSALGRTATTYNTSTYRNEHADALQRLADELDLIEAGADNVVRLHA